VILPAFRLAVEAVRELVTAMRRCATGVSHDAPHSTLK